VRVGLTCSFNFVQVLAIGDYLIFIYMRNIHMYVGVCVQTYTQTDTYVCMHVHTHKYTYIHACLHRVEHKCRDKSRKSATFLLSQFSFCECVWMQKHI
jgi:hypothetical protein